MLRVLEGCGSGTRKLKREGLGRQGCDDLGCLQFEDSVNILGRPKNDVGLWGVGRSSLNGSH